MLRNGRAALRGLDPPVPAGLTCFSGLTFAVGREPHELQQRGHCVAQWAYKSNDRSTAVISTTNTNRWRRRTTTAKCSLLRVPPHHVRVASLDRTGEARRGESELWLSKSPILLSPTRAEVKPSIANLIHQRFNPARAVPPSHFIPFHFAITATAEVSPSTRSTGALLSVVV
ncbi:hypothetical protein CPLU01_04700 [Colletotrichum plurivorum]|uniref:Uncharacterized protein n=1 Tax=Colletotrichum plurivorum TaxID=2175906 RepID=A0A8H6KNX5_9PEZI|nr:hypothetical protein CPLU01_04700 [Colletotrichum plurivorum]